MQPITHYQTTTGKVRAISALQRKKMIREACAASIRTWQYHLEGLAFEYGTGSIDRVRYDELSAKLNRWIEAVYARMETL